MGSFVEWLDSGSAAVVSILLLVICSVITLWNVVMHLANYSRDDLQRHITRIILVVPIYALASWLEIRYPSTAIFCHALVDFWEALVIYSFFNLILEYVGGEHNWLVCVQHTHPDGLKHTPPFSWCFRKSMDLDPTWLRNCKIACFQFVFVKPLVGLIFLPFLIAGTYYDAPWPVVRDVVYNITYTVALYALALLYMTTHKHPSLKPKRPLAKFTSVKLVIFFTYWQRYILLIFGLTEEELVKVIAFLTLVEMMIMAVPINWIAFPWREFQTGLVDGPDVLERGSMSPSDKLRHGVNRFNKVVRNASKIFSPEDVVDSASHNFGSKYKTHVLLESSQEYVIEDNPTGDPSSKAATEKKKVFRAKTYLIGGLSPVSDASPSSVRSAVPPAVSLGQPATLPESDMIGEPMEEDVGSPPAQSAVNSSAVPLLPIPPRPKQYMRLEEEFDQ